RGAQLVQGELWSAGLVAAREHAARGMDLDDVDAVLELRPHHVADLVDAVGDLEGALLGERVDAPLRRVAVQVAVPAGDRDARPARHDARSRELTFGDRVAQVSGKERRRAQVAHGGEAGLQRGPRVAHRADGGAQRAVAELQNRRVLVGAGAEVDVAVDESRQQGGVAEIDHLRPRRGRQRGGGPRGDDALALDQHGGALAQAAGQAVEEPRRLQIDRARARQRRGGLRGPWTARGLSGLRCARGSGRPLLLGESGAGDDEAGSDEAGGGKRCPRGWADGLVHAGHRIAWNGRPNNLGAHRSRRAAADQRGAVGGGPGAAGTSSANASPRSSTTPETSTSIGARNIGPADAKVWNSPFSPQGSTPAGRSGSSAASHLRPPNAVASLERSTQASLASSPAA